MADMAVLLRVKKGEAVKAGRAFTGLALDQK
jgi:hypothetical protein